MKKELYISICEKYLNNQATPNEMKELIDFIKEDLHFNNWLENQIENASTEMDSQIKMKLFERIKSDISQEEHDIRIEQTKNAKIEVSKKKTKFFKLSILKIAAVFIPVVLLLGAYFLNQTHTPLEFTVIASRGEKASLILPDGSKIVLNSESQIKYLDTYNKKDRNIKMTGEALFEVNSNKQKPFIVESPYLKVEVLGTVFGMKDYADEELATVVLNSGSVKLTTATTEVKMHPNEFLAYNKYTGAISTEDVNAQDFMTWENNYLRFNNEALENIIKTLSRLHDIDIELDNSINKSKTFTGTIDNSNLLNVLDAICLTAGLQYNIKDRIVYLSKK